ncbi:hypothetical protein HKD37_20G056416 [Glycine soja]
MQAIPAPCPQVFSAMAEEFVNGFVHQNGIAVITHNPPKAIPAPRPQVAEDEFLPQHIHLKRFRLHARKLLRMSFYHNTFTSIFFAMAEEFVNGFVHQNGIAVITHNPPKGDGEKKTKIWIILVVVVGLICLGIHIFLVWRFKRKPKAISSAFGYNNNIETFFSSWHETFFSSNSRKGKETRDMNDEPHTHRVLLLPLGRWSTFHSYSKEYCIFLL